MVKAMSFGLKVLYGAVAWCVSRSRHLPARETFCFSVKTLFAGLVDLWIVFQAPGMAFLRLPFFFGFGGEYHCHCARTLPPTLGPLGALPSETRKLQTRFLQLTFLPILKTARSVEAILPSATFSTLMTFSAVLP